MASAIVASPIAWCQVLIGSCEVSTVEDWSYRSSRTSSRSRRSTSVIEDQDMDLRETRERGGVCAVGPSDRELLQETRRAHAERAKALPASGLSERRAEEAHDVPPSPRGNPV